MFVGSAPQVSLKWFYQGFSRACKIPQLIQQHVANTFLLQGNLWDVKLSLTPVEVECCRCVCCSPCDCTSTKTLILSYLLVRGGKTPLCIVRQCGCTSYLWAFPGAVQYLVWTCFYSHNTAENRQVWSYTEMNRNYLKENRLWRVLKLSCQAKQKQSFRFLA